MDSICFEKGDILVQVKEGSTYIIPYTYFIIERINEYSLTISPVSVGINRGERHIRLTEPFKLRLNLKTLLFEYRDESNVCRFKRFDINGFYNRIEGNNVNEVMGT